MLIRISPEDFADHILTLAGGKKADRSAVADALRRWSSYTAEQVMEGRHLTESQKDEWLRENEWSGL